MSHLWTMPRQQRTDWVIVVAMKESANIIVRVGKERQ